MLSIITDKINNTLKQYLHRNTFANRILDIRDIISLREKVKAREPWFPMSGFYRAQPFEEPMDLDSLTAELDLISIDASTISDYLDKFYETVRERVLLNEINKLIYSKKIRKITNDAVFFTSDQFIAGFTTEVDFKSGLNEKTTDADTSSSGLKLFTSQSEPQSSLNLSPDAINISVDRFAGVVGDDKFSPEIKGNKVSLIDSSFSNGVYVTVYSLLTEQIGVNFRVNVNLTRVNNLDIFLEPSAVGQYMQVMLEDTTGKQDIVYTNIVNGERAVVTFSERDIRFATISVYQKLPTTGVAGVNVYKFNMRKFRFGRTARVFTATAETLPIDMKTDTKFISLVNEEVVPDGTSIKHLISYDSDVNGNPINFFSVIPTTREGQNKSENFVRIGTKRFTESISHNTQKKTAKDWSYLSPDKTFGGKLYVIADVSSAIDLKKVTISDDSVRLFRGIGDWSIVREKVKTTTLYEKVTYQPKWNAEESVYDPVPIYLTFEEEVAPLDDHTMDLTHLVYPEGEYSFTDRNLKPLNIKISDFTAGEFSGKYRITVPANTFNPGVKYNVKYYFSLDNVSDKISSVLRNGTKIYTDGKTLVEGTDYNIVEELDKKRIVFVKSGSYRGERLYADFLIQLQDKVESRNYKVFMSTERNVDVTIGPFTKAEIEAGNYHKLNGEDISTLTSLTLTAGSYIFESSQPFRGVNQKTKLSSGAFIDIPSSEVELRGFEASLRRVPIYELVLNSGTDDRQFAFLDGKIYLNRIPDYASILSADAEGKYLKTITFDSDFNPISIPETFRMEFDYDDGTKPKNITIKIVLSNDKRTGNDTPELRRLGINQYNTDPPEVKAG